MTSDSVDTQFWRDIVQAYEQVSRDASLQITVERENKRALVRDNQGVIVIMIDDAPNDKPPVLIVPPGQGTGES